LDENIGENLPLNFDEEREATHPNASEAAILTIERGF
jgi:hypothetical protein